MKFQYSDLLVLDLHTNSCNALRSSTGSLTLLLHLVCIKVSASLATALIPPHVLAQVLLPDHPAVHCPLVACALVRESSFGQEKKGETCRLAREHTAGVIKITACEGRKGQSCCQHWRSDDVLCTEASGSWKCFLQGCSRT